MSWSKMFISRSEHCVHTESEQSEHSDPVQNGFIISYDEPVKYEENKKIILEYSISDLDEVIQFYEQYNTMSTGNITLLPRSELELYLSFDHVVVLMRSEKGKLMGVVISIILPVKCSYPGGDRLDEIINPVGKNEIIKHGCTTFLVVHPSIRGHGMCMALIRGLINKGYEKRLYCDYHTIPFKLGDNSFSVNSYYRPINLKEAIELGFLFPNYNDIRFKTRNRLLYSNKLKNGYSYTRVKSTYGGFANSTLESNCNVRSTLGGSDCNNSEKALEYYYESVRNKKFAFYPDTILWNKWVDGFPTYLIYYNDTISGIVSINTIFCIMCAMRAEGAKGKVASPVICNGYMDIILNVLPAIVSELGFDVLYFHAYGDVTSAALEQNHYIKTNHVVWFSLYNNCISVNNNDISVPFL